MDDYHYERECENCGKKFIEYGVCDPPGWYDGRSYFHGYHGGNLVWWDTHGIYSNQYLLCDGCLSKKSVIEKYKKKSYAEAMKIMIKRIEQSEKDYIKSCKEHECWIANERIKLKDLKNSVGDIKHRCKPRGD